MNKKLLLLVFAGTLAATAQDQGRRPSPEALDSQTLIELERGNWDAVKHKDAAFLKRMWAPDYFDFGSDGRVTGPESLNMGSMASGSQLLEFSWTDFQLKFISPDVALVTYRGKYRGTIDGKADAGEAYYSSLYRKQHGRWLMVFTQDSNLKCAGL
jgi:hypothetical protein